jgi:hypothetical protein
MQRSARTAVQLKKETSMSLWIEDRLFDLTHKNIELLLEHKIPGILIKNLISKEDCLLAAERLKAMSFQQYGHLKNIPVHHLGVCHNQWVSQEKSIYFSQVEEANRLAQSVFDGICENPVDKLLALLNSITPREAKIFEEDTSEKYFAGAFRSFSGHGRLHIDHAPSHILSDWAVTKIKQQLTWNIYLSVLNTGGELVIYDTIHTPENELMKVPGEYYFPYSVLESDHCLKINPEIGDLIIFNTQNFHEILGNEDGRRISQTSFIGVKSDGSLNLWS